jgi:hypothetical protein
VLVDQFDMTRAIDTTRGETGGCLRYVLDMVGREAATIYRKRCVATLTVRRHIFWVDGGAEEPTLAYSLLWYSHQVPSYL